MALDGLSWQVIGLIAAALAVWNAALFGAIKFLLSNYRDEIRRQFVSVGDNLGAHTLDLHRIDKEILKLRAELPRDYVRREDAIREQVVINAKLDALGAKIDQLNLRSGGHGD